MGEGGERKEPIFRDIRRYLCDYCGIFRSKKALIRLDRIQDPETTCLDDCQSSYRQKDHLTRHLFQHQRKLFTCPVENFKRRFAFQGNMKRHVKKFHDEESPLNDVGSKYYVYPEVGCEKVFKFVSKLQKQEDSHAKLDSVCSKLGCFKHFTNEQCPMAHLQSYHQHIICEICGTKHLKKNIKRHLRTHESGFSSERVKRHFKGCLHTFLTKSNLDQHVEAMHLKLRPFVSSIPGCSMRLFPFKHVRDNHEKTGGHVYTHGDFEELDEQFRLRPRGGKKRKSLPIEALLRKRVTPPS
ncbi:hypothetical protein AAG906_003797 [Vitis piasezkii]